MKQYTSYCSKEQTEKAFKLGAPIEYKRVGFKRKVRVICPTIQQILGWLVQKGFGFCIDTSVSPSLFVVLYKQRVQVKSIHMEGCEYKDYILGLNHLINTALNFLEHQIE